LARVAAVRTTGTKPQVATTDLTETAATTITAETTGDGSTEGAETAEVEGATEHAPTTQEHSQHTRVDAVTVNWLVVSPNFACTAF
jgi:hypothetical protein